MNHKLNQSTKLLIIAFLCFVFIQISFSIPEEQNSEKGFVSIFDGKTLNGWTGDSTYWRVENGCIIGEVKPQTLLKRNSFIIWRGDMPANFELKLEYRISENGNSGINYRSEKVEGLPYALRGYQFDIDGANKYTGQNYEERGRTTLAYHGQKVLLKNLSDSIPQFPLTNFIEKNAWTKSQVTGVFGDIEELNSNIKAQDWNTCYIIANENLMQHYINGILISEVTDNDINNRKLKGLIGVQVHVGPPMKIEYRNIRLKKL